MGGSAHDFDWDSANTKKCEKHGVSIAEIELLFARDPGIYFDAKHSTTEQRYYAIGKDSGGRYVLVVFTHRERDGVGLIRPVSARYMHAKEINRFNSYEKET